MRKNIGLIALLLMAYLPINVFASPSEVKCKNANFPNHLGSDLVLKFKNGIPTDAYLYLGKEDILQTMGWYRVHTALNENETPVIYLNWVAGAGNETTPRTMVIYAFDDNYENDKTLFLGVIEWIEGGKLEKHYIYKCE